MALYIDSQITCLSALADRAFSSLPVPSRFSVSSFGSLTSSAGRLPAPERAAINPSFAKLIIKNYAQSKLVKGKTRAETGWKLDALEQELVAMRVRSSPSSGF